MAVNIFGPHGPGINEVTERPSSAASGSSVDTWFGPCIDGDPNTGTKISYRWLNFMTANMREAIRGMGVAEDELDDELLLKCFQSVQSNFSLSSLMNMPFYPAILNTEGKFTFSTSTGQIVIGTGHTFLHRGHKLYSTTSDFDAGARTFATVANKTYHLRWYPPGHANANAVTYPKGRFMLRDLADGGYNPGAALEAVSVFDTGYDDMLVARVTTNGANSLTVTALANFDRYKAHIVSDFLTPSANPGANGASRTFAFAYNLARTPQAIATVERVAIDAPTDFDYYFQVNNRSRYGCDVVLAWDCVDQMQTKLSYDL